MEKEKAVILFSGGLDSTVLWAWTEEQGYDRYALIFGDGRYRDGDFPPWPVGIDFTKGRAVEVDLIQGKPEAIGLQDMIPGRNMIFLSYAFAWAETLGAKYIFIGANLNDYNGFTDCRPLFLQVFQQTANLASYYRVPAYHVEAPFIGLTKAQIIDIGIVLNVDFAKTRSCYELDNEGVSCGQCHSCLERLNGFKEVGREDPIPYKDEGGSDGRDV